MHIAPSKNLVSIDVPLEQHPDGYPPVSAEPLWAAPAMDGLFEIRSIPFFANGLAKGDLVEANERDGRLVFQRVVKPSGRSVLRVVFQQAERITQALSDIERMGCFREFYPSEKLYAFDVPLAADLRAVVTYLSIGEENKWWHLEQACIGR